MLTTDTTRIVDATPATEYYTIRYSPDDEALTCAMPALLDNADLDDWDRYIFRKCGASYLQKLAGIPRYPYQLQLEVV